MNDPTDWTIVTLECGPCGGDTEHRQNGRHLTCTRCEDETPGIDDGQETLWEIARDDALWDVA